MRKIKYIIAGISAAVFMVSCELDNFDGPDAQVYGAVIDAETEELIQQEIGTSGDAACVQVIEYGHHPSVSTDPSQQELYKKYFPNGGGSIFTFEIKGDAQKAKDFIDNLELFSLLANVADVKSLVIHPATTTHSQCTEEELLDQGIKPNTIRLSIGTENIDDIIQDLDEAFKAVAE